MKQNYVPPKKANITHPVILFKLTKSYNENMEPWQLYTATRGQWDMNLDQAQKFKYALACDAGLVVEVYEIQSWHKSNETMNEKELAFRRAKNLHAGPGKLEFVGEIATEEIRKQ